MNNKKVLVSGIQASGRLHFGNYFGAMRQNIALANGNEYESYIFVADYHALTTVKDKEALSKATLGIVANYIACGLDADKAIIFKQSDIPEHTELCAILNNVVTVPYLMRAHAFKDHEAKSKEVSAGLFDYPVLMAADILMYQANTVPVGQDQKQHVEYARDIAGFYNRAWEIDYFKVPREYILENVATVPGIDGQKMSKSKGNTIPLFGSEEELKKLIMSIVTDSLTPEERKNPDENIIFNIHKLFLNDKEVSLLRSKFEEGGYSYKEAKDDLYNTIIDWRKDKKEIYNNLMNNPKEIKEILEKGAKKAKRKASETMKDVRLQTGLDF